MATSTNESDLHAESDHEESATTPKSLKSKDSASTQYSDKCCHDS